MIEHRLIERMIVHIRAAVAAARETGGIDPAFVDVAVDFIRFYADRTHHGKEEDILFRELEARDLSPEHRQVMEDLVRDHTFGRQTTAALVAANERYRRGEAGALAEVIAHLQALCAFYPVHIAKEDRVFFPAALTYVTAEEDAAMIAAFWEFDRKLIHEKYRAVVQALAQR